MDGSATLVACSAWIGEHGFLTNSSSLAEMAQTVARCDGHSCSPPWTTAGSRRGRVERPVRDSQPPCPGPYEDRRSHSCSYSLAHAALQLNLCGTGHTHTPLSPRPRTALISEDSCRARPSSAILAVWWPSDGTRSGTRPSLALRDHKPRRGGYNLYRYSCTGRIYSTVFIYS